MNEAKAKKLIIASTVGAVLMLVILLFVMIYQLADIAIKQKKIEELDAKIAQYEQLIQEGEDTLEARSMRWWIERRARELGYIYKTDVPLGE